MSRSTNETYATQRLLQMYCSPIPYSLVRPAFDAAVELAGLPNNPFQVSFSSPYVMALYLTSIQPVSTYTCFEFKEGSYLTCDTNESFWFAVDKNGVVRMCGMPPDLAQTYKTFNNQVLPYLFGTETTGFKNGDRMYIYYSDLNNNQLWWADSGEGDGGYTFDTTQTTLKIIQGGELKNAFLNQKCLPELNLTIWGWLDEVGDDLNQLDFLESELETRPTQEQFDTLQTQLDARPTQEQLNTLQTQLDARPTKEELDALQTQLDERPTITPSDSQYGAFFETLNQGLTDSISRLNSALGNEVVSNEAEDEVDGEQSNFSGKDPFRYKKNKY